MTLSDFIKTRIFILFFIGYPLISNAQTTTIPLDFRQHNLVKYNRSLLNPAFSFIDSEHQQVSVWSRFQWTSLELPPTSVFANYTRRIGENNGIGIGVFQHDFGIFTANGLLLNYSRVFNLSRETHLTIGINVIPIQRSIDRNNFSVEEFNMLPESVRADAYIVRAMPGINFRTKNFNIGIVSENLFDYNFTQSDTDTSFDDKILLIHAGYDFRLESSYDFLDDAKFRIGAYAKTIPTVDNQLGGNLFLDTKIGWAQAGYNSFYGPSFGLGAKLFDALAIGGLVEFENDIDNIDVGPTFEVVATWEFKPNNGNSRRRRAFAGPVKKKKEKIIPPKKTILPPPVDNSEKETLTEEAFKAKNKEGERYSILNETEDIEPGFYLVVNVYETQKYFNAFLEKLTREGLNPQYFFNKENNYYYVYLKRYNNLSEIEAARDSNYNGKYTDEAWILWVKKPSKD
ncbi:type IX secretion system membrane protein PorP/SprF [Flavobacteriaceae bacterium R38]|nr:type IX secretion system membrane protein PorP/SprF [Flavobacteriaceae bacterium R38]